MSARLPSLALSAWLWSSAAAAQTAEEWVRTAPAEPPPVTPSRALPTETAPLPDLPPPELRPAGREPSPSAPVITGAVDRETRASVPTVQFMASTSMDEAERALHELGPDIPPGLSLRIQPAVSGDVVYYRAVAVGFADREAARRFCDAWKRRGRACLAR